MSSTGCDPPASECGCCEGITKPTPVIIGNLPGLSTIGYRVGTHSEFKESMIASLNDYPALVPLTTRADDDLAIGLFDAWAMVADVLTFYQERIANEGFLRTAKERLSVLQLARSIGYELRPGVAASAYLAFTLDTTGSVSQATIDVGTKVQSMPLQGQTPPEMPQTFETVESIVALPRFNSLKPKLTVAQTLSDIEGSNHAYLAGTSTKLSPGDKLLLVSTSGSGHTQIQTPVSLRTVLSVTPEPPLQRTDVELAPASSAFDYATPASSSTALTGGAPSEPTPKKVGELTLSNIQYIIKTYASQSELVAYLTQQGWTHEDFAKVVNSYSQALDTSKTDVQVFAMRVKTGVFGNTAPAWNSLPASLTGFPTSGVNFNQYPYNLNWDDPLNPRSANENSRGASYASSFVASKLNGNVIDIQGASTADGTPLISYHQKPSGTDNQLWQMAQSTIVYLGSSFPSIKPKGWVVLADASESVSGAFPVSGVSETSLADFMINAKVTGLTLSLNSFPFPRRFTMRGTTVYANSEELQLADIPDDSPVKGLSTKLDTVVAGLQVGQKIAVAGRLSLQSSQSTSETASEIVTIADVVPYEDGSPFTTIYLQSPGLANSYTRDAFEINANVALATHGSTVSREILGGGSPSSPYLTFNLKRSPLAFTSSPSSPTGTKSTLKVWVSNGAANIRWNEAPSLYGIAPNSQSYAVRIQDDGTVSVLFGNARPPAGSENITATYRVGIGSGGMLEANQLTLLGSRPLGVRGVTNPLPTSGAADPENIDDARQNAPLQVLTLGRVVSLKDCENFARSFQGIGKALAVSAWDGETRIIRLIVASATQGKVTDPLLTTLKDAIGNFADPLIQVRIESFNELTFNIGGWVVFATDQDPTAVLQNLLAALRSRFSFASMNFGEPVHLSDAIATIQHVEGVVATDVTSLYVYPPGPAGANDVLTCGVNELLVLNPDPQGVNLTVNTS